MKGSLDFIVLCPLGETAVSVVVMRKEEQTGVLVCKPRDTVSVEPVRHVVWSYSSTLAQFPSIGRSPSKPSQQRGQFAVAAMSQSVKKHLCLLLFTTVRYCVYHGLLLCLLSPPTVYDCLRPCLLLSPSCFATVFLCFQSYCHGCRWEFCRSTSHWLNTPVSMSRSVCVQSSTHMWSHCPQSSSPEERIRFRMAACWGRDIPPLQCRAKPCSSSLIGRRRSTPAPDLNAPLHRCWGKVLAAGVQEPLAWQRCVHIGCG